MVKGFGLCFVLVGVALLLFLFFLNYPGVRTQVYFQNSYVFQR